MVTSRIEVMIGRTLEREQRAGVPHFKPGQMEAKPFRGDLEIEVELQPGDAELLELYELSFVNAGGQACLVIVSRADGAWYPVYGLVGGLETMFPRAVSAISERAVEALDRACAERSAAA